MTFRDILQSDYFFNTYSQIEVMKRDFPVNHGFLHVWHVIQNASRFADIFSLSENDKRLLLIAAALHDVGYLKGRENHASNGSILAREYLKGKLTDGEIERVCSAIANHGGEEEGCYVDKISMCLVLADKFDFDHTRYRYDENHRESTLVYLSIQKVEFLEKGENYEFVITTSDVSLFDGYEERHFFKKLARVFSNFKKVTGKEITLSFVQGEREEEKERKKVTF